MMSVNSSETKIMVLKVDLGCDRCYKKIKKLLSKYPEIRDQTFNEKEDTVIIKVVCCCPEKIRMKLICKGGDTIKCIEDRPPEKISPPKKLNVTVEKPPAPAEKPPAPAPAQAPAQAPIPVREWPPFYPIGVCYNQCYEGHGGGPCHHGHGIPYKPPSYDGYASLEPSYDGYRYASLEPSYDGYGWDSGCRCNRSCGCRYEHFIEEDPTCTTM